MRTHKESTIKRQNITRLAIKPRLYRGESVVVNRLGPTTCCALVSDLARMLSWMVLGHTLPADWPTIKIPVVTFFFVSPAVFPADQEYISGAEGETIC